MSRTAKRATAIGATTIVAASGLALVGTGTATAQTCYFYRDTPQVSSIGPVHAGLADGDCSFIEFGEGYPGVDGHLGTIGVGSLQLTDDLWFVVEVDDVFGTAELSSTGPAVMPF